MNSTQRVILSLLVAWLVPSTVPAQVSTQRLIGAADEPQNWLTYSGSYMSQRYSRLAQVETGNVKNLKMKWVFQAQSLLTFSTTPLVVDGVMYLTQAPNDVFALDATTGRVFWTYKHVPDAGRLCCRGLVNRGVAISGNTLIMATVDAYLIALDARNGKPIWRTKVAEAKENYGMTLAPLVIKDKVVVGVAGGDFGIRGFIAAYDVANGKECWKFYTVPGPGEEGHETWGGNSWERGGASVWITGSYDPELNLTYWGVGNPWPDFDASGRLETISTPTASSPSMLIPAS
jgi:alcohol dehydrogenase (cytochrome c)